MVVRTKQKGLSLLEVLLVVGVMSVFVTGAAQIFDDWFKASVNNKVAREMLELQDAAEYFVKLNHETVLATLIPDVGDVDEVNIDDLRNEGFLSPEYRARNSFGQSLRVFVRNVNDATVGGVAVEVLTVADDLNGLDSRMADRRLFDAALAGGPRLGIVSAADLGVNCCDGNIQSVHGEWLVDLNDFSTVYTRTPDVNNGGYMAAYGRVSLNDDIDERYLYRVEVGGREHLNRMMTNLDMNNNDIVQAGTIVSDNTQVSGDTIVRGGAVGGLATPYVLSVQNGFEGNTLNITRNGDARGDLVVIGDNDNATRDLNISGDFALPATSGHVTTTLGTVSSIQNMGSGVFDTMNASGGVFNADTIVSQDTQIVGDVQTTFLQTSSASAGTVTSANGVVAITNVTGADTTISSDLNTSNGLAVQGDLNVNRIDNVDSLSIGTLQSCGSGCP